jgi:hypothetical protein
VTSIGGNLMLQGNAQLRDTAGLAVLTNVGADVLVQENPALATLSLPELASVGATGSSPTGIGPSSRQFYVGPKPDADADRRPGARVRRSGGRADLQQRRPPPVPGRRRREQGRRRLQLRREHRRRRLPVNDF